MKPQHIHDFVQALIFFKIVFNRKTKRTQYVVTIQYTSKIMTMMKRTYTHNII